MFSEHVSRYTTVRSPRTVDFQAEILISALMKDLKMRRTT
jgi:hypothetical protein